MTKDHTQNKIYSKDINYTPVEGSRPQKRMQKNGVDQHREDARSSLENSSIDDGKGFSPLSSVVKLLSSPLESISSSSPSEFQPRSLTFNLLENGEATTHIKSRVVESRKNSPNIDNNSSSSPSTVSSSPKLSSSNTIHVAASYQLRGKHNSTPFPKDYQHILNNISSSDESHDQQSTPSHTVSKKSKMGRGRSGSTSLQILENINSDNLVTNYGSPIRLNTDELGDSYVNGYNLLDLNLSIDDLEDCQDYRQTRSDLNHRNSKISHKNDTESECNSDGDVVINSDSWISSISNVASRLCVDKTIGSNLDTKEGDITTTSLNAMLERLRMSDDDSCEMGFNKLLEMNNDKDSGNISKIKVKNSSDLQPSQSDGKRQQMKLSNLSSINKSAAQLPFRKEQDLQQQQSKEKSLDIKKQEHFSHFEFEKTGTPNSDKREETWFSSTEQLENILIEGGENALDEALELFTFESNPKDINNNGILSKFQHTSVDLSDNDLPNSRHSSPVHEKNKQVEHKIVNKDFKIAMSLNEKKESFAIQQSLTTEGIGVNNSHFLKSPEHSKYTNTFDSLSTSMMLQSLQLDLDSTNLYEESTSISKSNQKQKFERMNNDSSKEEDCEQPQQSICTPEEIGYLRSNLKHAIIALKSVRAERNDIELVLRDVTKERNDFSERLFVMEKNEKQLVVMLDRGTMTESIINQKNDGPKSEVKKSKDDYRKRNPIEIYVKAIDKLQSNVKEKSTIISSLEENNNSHCAEIRRLRLSLRNQKTQVATLKKSQAKPLKNYSTTKSLVLSQKVGINKNTKKLKCNGSISQNRSMKKDDTKLLQITQKTKLFSVQEKLETKQNELLNMATLVEEMTNSIEVSRKKHMEEKRVLNKDYQQKMKDLQCMNDLKKNDISSLTNELAQIRNELSEKIYLTKYLQKSINKLEQEFTQEKGVLNIKLLKLWKDMKELQRLNGFQKKDFLKQFLRVNFIVKEELKKVSNATKQRLEDIEFLNDSQEVELRSMKNDILVKATLVKQLKDVNCSLKKEYKQEKEKIKRNLAQSQKETEDMQCQSALQKIEIKSLRNDIVKVQRDLTQITALNDLLNIEVASVKHDLLNRDHIFSEKDKEYIEGKRESDSSSNRDTIIVATDNLAKKKTLLQREDFLCGESHNTIQKFMQNNKRLFDKSEKLNVAYESNLIEKSDIKTHTATDEILQNRNISLIKANLILEKRLAIIETSSDQNKKMQALNSSISSKEGADTLDESHSKSANLLSNELANTKLLLANKEEETRIIVTELEQEITSLRMNLDDVEKSKRIVEEMTSKELANLQLQFDCNKENTKQVVSELVKEIDVIETNRELAINNLKASQNQFQLSKLEIFALEASLFSTKERLVNKENSKEIKDMKNIIRELVAELEIFHVQRKQCLDIECQHENDVSDIGITSVIEDEVYVNNGNKSIGMDPFITSATGQKFEGVTGSNVKKIDCIVNESKDSFSFSKNSLVSEKGKESLDHAKDLAKKNAKLHEDLPITDEVIESMKAQLCKIQHLLQDKELELADANGCKVSLQDELKYANQSIRALVMSLIEENRDSTTYAGLGKDVKNDNILDLVQTLAYLVKVHVPDTSEASYSFENTLLQEDLNSSSPILSIESKVGDTIKKGDNQSTYDYESGSLSSPSNLTSDEGSFVVNFNNMINKSNIILSGALENVRSDMKFENSHVISIDIEAFDCMRKRCEILEEERQIVLNETFSMIDNTRVANTIEIEAKLTAMKKNTTINIAKQRKHAEDRIELVIERMNKRYLKLKYFRLWQLRCYRHTKSKS